jgi:hypothetical protein
MWYLCHQLAMVHDTCVRLNDDLPHKCHDPWPTNVGKTTFYCSVRKIRWTKVQNLNFYHILEALTRPYIYIYIYI